MIKTNIYSDKLEDASDADLTNLAAQSIGRWCKDFNCYVGPLNFDPLNNYDDAMMLAIEHELLIDLEGGTCEVILLGEKIGNVQVFISRKTDKKSICRAITRASASLMVT